MWPRFDGVIMSRLLTASLAVLTLGLGSAARADDWSSLPPPPPVAKPDKDKAPEPAPITLEPAKEPEKPAADKGYVPPPTVPVTTPAPVPADPLATIKDAPAGETVTKETVLPGTEPHSPGTYGNSLTAPANLRVTSTTTGGTGLLRLGSADLGKPGVFRVSLHGEFFQLGDFPVLKAENTRTAGTLAIDWTVLKWVELYLSYGASANTNSKSSPPLLQAQGDLRFGVKGAIEALKGLYVGADLNLIAFPGVGAQDLRKYAFGFAPKLLVTFDVRKFVPKAPFRLHVNFGGIIDGTGDLVDSAHTPTPAEEFALGLHKYNRLSFGAGLEAPLPWVTPFVEYGFAFPLGTSTLLGPDLQPVTAAASMPQQLTLGLKVTAPRDLTIVLACEIGLTKYVAMGIPATPPYNLVFGLSYAFDPMARGTSKLVERTVTVEKKVEVATPAPVYTGKVAGTVVDAETKQPIAGAVVAASGTGIPPVASDVEGGRFLTHELPAGKLSLTFARDGYKPAALEATVEAGKVSTLEALLTREVKNTVAKVSLFSGKQKAGGRITFAGPKIAELVVANEGGTVELPKGHYAASVAAEGYLSKIHEFDVPEGGTLNVSIELALKPKQSLVVVKEDRIQIRQQVHFATGKATILADSFQLLDQVIDAIIRANVKKLRIEGHTDNQGGKDLNLKLSQSRADAVADYLVKKGVERSRLLAEGFGDTKPVAPNLTARGREQNRRVEFMILEK